MNIQMFTLPVFQNTTEVEKKYCELLSAKRSGEVLPEEILDWMDTANTWLTEVSL